jgi:cytochrome c-type biogenesis protein CcmH
MTEFWIIGALLLAVALAFVLWPLLRGIARADQVASDAANLEVFRDQVAEMDADLANGLLTPELYEQGKRELEARLLDEVKSPEGSKAEARARNTFKVLAAALAVLIPVASVGLYWKLGNQNALLPQEQHVGADGAVPMLSANGIKELEDELAKNPNNPEGWRLLAVSNTQLEHWADAAKAYKKLTELVPNDAQLWADYADVVAMVHGQSMAGPPTALLEKALALDPNNFKALAMAGSAAMERGDYPAAVQYWESLLRQLPPDSPDAKMIEGALQQARDFLAQSKGGKMRKRSAQAPAAPQDMAPAAGKERISGTVTLGDAIKAQASPDDTVFIIARDANGSPMPLAVVRTKVKELPFKFSLDDSMAMNPQMKLSGAGKVVVVARVSKTGDAKAQPGDLQGASASVAPGATAVKIRIDSVVK